MKTDNFGANNSHFGKFKISISYDELLDLYIFQNKTMPIIAKELNVCVATVSAYLHRFGIRKARTIKEPKTRNPKKSLVGKVCDKLTILELAKGESLLKLNHNEIYICYCECGDFTERDRYYLINKDKSEKCCINCAKNNRNKKRRPMLIGQKFSKLLVKEDFGRTEGGRVLWKCLCDCGGEKITTTKLLRNGSIQSCGCLSRPFGKDNPNWNDNLTEQDRIKRRLLPEYKEWSKQVKERDNFTCQVTGQEGGVNAHHLNGWHWSKDGRLDINNGITISERIHNLFHSVYGNRNNTKEQFLEFKERYNNGEFNDK